MHPGSPLTIVGVEQGDNDIRSRTPALMNSDFKPASVNLDDAYQRKLQMYETGARFGAPLAIASAASAPSAPRPVVEAVQPVIAEAPVMDKAASRQVLQWAVSILVAAGICLWGYKRFASRAEDVEAQS
ncbi:MAG: hypothetical protein JNL28_12110 [Planctomycetes bacterium]|nr:hypothetical protein [Planctomycetota bacterium]